MALPPNPGTRWLRDDHHSLLLAGMAWTLIVLMIVPDGFDYQALLDSNAPAAGSMVSRLLWLGLLAFSSLVVLWRLSLASVLVGNLNPFLLAFVVLALASVAWSIEPTITIRRDIRLVTILLVCVAFVLAGWHARRLQAVVRPLLTLLLLGSLVFGLVSPSLAIHQETSSELLGAWRGLTNHKNSLGALSCMTLIFWMESWLAQETKTRWALAGSALAVACLLLSRSSTSLIAALFTTLLLALLAKGPRAVQPYIRFGCTLLVVMLIVYALAILKLIPGLQVLLAPVALLTGSDMTFTGRSEIWAIMTEHISLNPLFGTGYGAYWTGPSPQSPSFEFIIQMQSFYPGSAHNGYLEVTNDLGWIGLACLLGYLVIHLRQSLKVLAIEGAQGGLYLALFIQQAITNLSESHWFSVLSVHFVMMTLASAALARLLLEQRLRARHGEPTHDARPARVLAETAELAPGLALHRLRRQR